MSASVVHAKSRLRWLLPPVIGVLFLSMLPVSAYGEDDQSIAALRQMGKAFATIAGKASPAVVGIKATKAARSSLRSRDESDDGSNSPLNEDDLFEYFFRRRLPRQYQRPQPKEIAQGSGFVATADGYILTNNHLVGETEKVSVKLADGRTMDAKVIGADADSDVAVIKIEAEGLPFLELADSASLEVGEWVIAIGNPFGLSHTVTAGIVSAKGRSSLGVANYEDFIQTDAAINFGNSGGPLLNLDGKVVGINTAIIGLTGNVGIGLAIPINMAKDIYKQLRESGSVVRGFLGVVPTDIEPDMAEFFGLKKEVKGVLISQVTDNSAADEAGIKRGDVVTEFDGVAVDSANDFRNRVAMHKPGSEIGMVILREGKRMDVTVKLAQRPTDDVASSEQVESPGKLGFSVQALTDDLAQRLGYEGLDGVVVTDVEAGSEADEKGIERGALIREVDRERIHNVREFKDAVREAQGRGKILLLVRDGGVDRYVVLQQDKGE
ncbi:MAG: Do family serine endopeptidase [Sedimentisphaerales bacterium]|nr:Do family serine endopeptidase [Sedimentisphaerales bacterium]